jgi:hypothetical protein
MFARRVVLLSACLVLSGVASARAEPFGGGGGHFGHRGFAFGFDNYFDYYDKFLDRDWAFEMERIPYYSLHPPVYYSLPVPRTYGWSPFAYPPGTMTPELQMAPAVEPQTLLNPYVPQAPGAPSAAAEQTTYTPTPKVIVNPFVEEAVASEEAPAARVARFGEGGAAQP